MTVPSDKNPRIIVAEIAVRNLKEGLKNKAGFRPKLSSHQLNQLAQEINSKVQKLKYSYVEDLANNDTTKEIVSLATKIYDAVFEAYHGGTEGGKEKKKGIPESTVLWATRLLMRLSERLNEPFRPTIESGIDMQVIGIRNIFPIPNTNLFVSRVYNGSEDYTVITNLKSLKSGMRVGVAYLPPVEIGGELSEAMYLSNKEYPENTPYGTYIYEDANFGDVRNILKQEFMKRAK